MSICPTTAHRVQMFYAAPCLDVWPASHDLVAGSIGECLRFVPNNLSSHVTTITPFNPKAASQTTNPPGFDEVACCCSACKQTHKSRNPLKPKGQSASESSIPDNLQFADTNRCQVCRFQHHLCGKPKSFEERCVCAYCVC